MFRHIALIVSLTFVALAAGVAMVPGEREQWTMLVRDGRNQEAMAALEARYRAGKREIDAVLHLYKLHMAFAEVERATSIMRAFAADHPHDPAVLALLARHYSDVEDRAAEIGALEQLFALAPTPATARQLLAYYRLDGSFDREQRLLRTLLADQMITANDAERLGLMLLAAGDLYGARDALVRFDEVANPERSVGRLALFDVLVRTGDTTAAMNKALTWIGYWRKPGVHRGGSENPTRRIVQMMMAADPLVARRVLCGTAADAAPADTTQEAACAALERETETDPAGTTMGKVEPDDTLAHRGQK
jgi:tetratricopeptide (TPR) repeat protein